MRRSDFMKMGMATSLCFASGGISSLLTAAPDSLGSWMKKLGLEGADGVYTLRATPAGLGHLLNEIAARANGAMHCNGNRIHVKIGDQPLVITALCVGS